MALILNPINVECQANRLRVVDDGEFWGGAEPYLWSAFFKVDGESVTANLNIGLGIDFSLNGTATVFSPDKGSHGNLVIEGGSIGDGEFANIPEDVGKFTTELLPIPLTITVPDFIEELFDSVVLQIADIITGLDSDSLCPPLAPNTSSLLSDMAVEFVTEIVGGIPGVFGGIYVLMEEDFLSEQSAEEGRLALRDNLQVELDDIVIPGISLENPAPSDSVVAEMQSTIQAGVEGAIVGSLTPWDYIGLFFLAGDVDDPLGTVHKMMSHIDVEAGSEETFSETLDATAQGHGEWELRGRIGAAG